MIKTKYTTDKKYMIIPDCYRPSPKYPTYPPYHKGLYLEDYFYNFSQGKTFSRTYIPIFWTTMYCDNVGIPIQPILNRLDKNGKYFIVCQHDDAPRETLPPDTLIFSSGGHYDDKPLIPLPSICSPIENPNKNRNRDIFCSFVGSITHNIRTNIINTLSNNQKYVLSYNNWTPSVPMEKFYYFKDITERSVFSLCPRGYGKSSNRMYESMQLGSIPVYVSDKHFLPWQDELDWSNLIIIIKDSEIEKIDDILTAIPQSQIDRMREYTSTIYNKYFSLEGVCNNIYNRVK